MIKKIIQRGPHYLKVFNKLNRQDVILVSYPKSGNTWIRNILANYIGLTELNKDKITFKELDEIMPGLGREDFFQKWTYTVPKFSATHLKYILLFKKTKNVLVIRDPRDVMVSYFYYLNKKKNGFYFENIYDLLIHPKFGLKSWFKHTMSWFGNIDFLIVYEEMLYDDDSIMEDLFKKIGSDFQKSKLYLAVENSRFKNFKKIEEKYGHSKPETITKDFSFARKGESGDYLNHFDKRCEKYYEKCLNEFGFDDYDAILNMLKKSCY